MYEDNSLQDYAHAEPGEAEEITCRICGVSMDVTRNANGSTSWGGAMAGIKHVHDFFHCHHRNKDWHRQAKALLKLANETPSMGLAEMFYNEASSIITNMEATKTFRDF